MSTDTDVVPEAGWYRDPAHPGIARWWDGSAWGTQTQQIPTVPPSSGDPSPAPQAAAPEYAAAQPPVGVIGVASPEAFAPDQSQAKKSRWALPTREPKEPKEPKPPKEAKAPKEPKPAKEPKPPKQAKAVKEPKPPKEPKAGKPFGLSSGPRLSMPSVNPLIAVLLVVLLAGAGWYAYTNLLTGSSTPAAVTPRPSASTSTPGKTTPPPAKAIKVVLPAKVSSELGGLPWWVESVATTTAAKVVADQSKGKHRVIASFYGQTPAERFFFVGSTVTRADRKAVSVSATRVRLTHLLAVESGTKPTGAALVRSTAAGLPGTVDCLTARAGADTMTVCAWQNSTVRITVISHGPTAATQGYLRQVITTLTH